MADGPEPYTPPSDAAQMPADASADPRARLFTANQVAIATFVGTALAGGILMGLNERRLGRPDAMARQVIVGFLAALVTFGVAFVLPEEFPAAAIALAPVFGMRAYAQQAQGEVVGARVKAVGSGSGWQVAGVSSGALVVAVIGFGGISYAAGDLDWLFQSRVEMPGGEVLYDDGLDAEARQVGDALQEVGWFQAKGDAAAELHRGERGYVVCLYVVDGAWTDSETRGAARLVETFLEDEVFGRGKVEVELCDALGEQQTGFGH